MDLSKILYEKMDFTDFRFVNLAIRFVNLAIILPSRTVTVIVTVSLPASEVIEALRHTYIFPHAHAHTARISDRSTNYPAKKSALACV